MRWAGERAGPTPSSELGELRGSPNRKTPLKYYTSNRAGFKSLLGIDEVVDGSELPMHCKNLSRHFDDNSVANFVTRMPSEQLLDDNVVTHTMCTAILTNPSSHMTSVSLTNNALAPFP